MDFTLSNVSKISASKLAVNTPVFFTVQASNGTLILTAMKIIQSVQKLLQEGQTDKKLPYHLSLLKGK